MIKHLLLLSLGNTPQDTETIFYERQQFAIKNDTSISYTICSMLPLFHTIALYQTYKATKTLLYQKYAVYRTTDRLWNFKS